jgi:rhamnogalacturonan endolyase
MYWIRIPVCAAVLAAGLWGADAPVTIVADGRLFTLSNGYLTAQVNKTSGDLVSLKVGDIETMGFRSGHHAGYWEQTPAKAAQLTASLTIDPSKNGGERGEVSIKGISGGKALDGDGVKLNGSVFDWLSIDAKRNLLMPSGDDWDKGSALNMKEARRLTTGVYTGKAEHKYDYSALQFEIPAFGWSSTKQHVGFYFINPSTEYLSGGATKVELTGHLDNGNGGDPTLLDYWRGTHYGSSMLPIAAGEEWSKVVGPILIYVNSGADPQARYRDALAQAAEEAGKWPYAWVSGVDYPQLKQRGTVSGQLALVDPQAASTRMPNLLVGLAHPDAPPMTWQNDAKHYEFWVRGTADGRFSIPKVRPGTYELHAISDGVLGEFAKESITVGEGQTVDLGKLEWKPVRHGRQLWEIGIPNRSGAEFFKGDDYFHWGWYLEYPKLFPDDVHFTLGKSDYRKDWFFEQVPHAEQSDPAGRGNGRATTWTVEFVLPKDAKGQATLRLALAGVSSRSIAVAVNDKPAGTVTGLAYNATINRDGIQGSWVEKDVTFDAALMKEGHNTLTLTIPAGGVTSGIIYDYLRLELDDR